MGSSTTPLHHRSFPENVAPPPPSSSTHIPQSTSVPSLPSSLHDNESRNNVDMVDELADLSEQSSKIGQGQQGGGESNQLLVAELRSVYADMEKHQMEIRKKLSTILLSRVAFYLKSAAKGESNVKGAKGECSGDGTGENEISRRETSLSTPTVSEYMKGILKESRAMARVLRQYLDSRDVALVYSDVVHGTFQNTRQYLQFSFPNSRHSEKVNSDKNQEAEKSRRLGEKQSSSLDSSATLDSRETVYNLRAFTANVADAVPEVRELLVASLSELVKQLGVIDPRTVKGMEEKKENKKIENGEGKSKETEKLIEGSVPESGEKLHVAVVEGVAPAKKELEPEAQDEEEAVEVSSVEGGRRECEGSEERIGYRSITSSHDVLLTGIDSPSTQTGATIEQKEKEKERESDDISTIEEVHAETNHEDEDDDEEKGKEESSKKEREEEEEDEKQREKGAHEKDKEEEEKEEQEEEEGRKETDGKEKEEAKGEVEKAEKNEEEQRRQTTIGRHGPTQEGEKEEEEDIDEEDDERQGEEEEGKENDSELDMEDIDVAKLLQDIREEELEDDA